MFGTFSEEREVHAPASEAWKLYGTLELSKLIRETLSSIVTKAEVVEGNGGVGTVLEIYMRTGPEEGAPIMRYKEKFTVVDHENRCKETEIIEGGFLDLGFTLYRLRLEVIEKEEQRCITKFTVEYEVKEEHAHNAKLVSLGPYVAVLLAAKDRLEKKS